MSAPPASAPDWTLIIRPRGRWFDLRLRELWQYRDLIGLFVWRDFVATYKQTILGPLWHLIQPLFTTLTYTLIFGRVAGLSTDGLPQFLFYLAGTVLWTYFAACLNKASSTFIVNANIFGKVYFPRLAVPVSHLFSNLIAFAIQFALFLAFMAFFAIQGAPLRPNYWILLSPALVFIMAGLGLGFGILISALTTRYRDLQHLVTFGVQLLMFATPVIYPVSAIPQKYQPIILANPMTPVLETFRYAFMGSGTVNLYHLAYSLAVTVLVLLGGMLLFNRVERTFMDTV